MKKALITGVSGQDGAYLAALLLRLGYRVYGGCRDINSIATWRLIEVGALDNDAFSLVHCDITDSAAMLALIRELQPAEIYNFAAQSSVAQSFKKPLETGLVTGIAVVNILEAIRRVDPTIRFLQASSAEMYGSMITAMQTQDTPFSPTNPYGAAKLYAHSMVLSYQKSYNMFAASAVLFNHESPLRGLEFVTRKITQAVAHIKLGLLDCLELGNLEALRDWGYAKDYVEGMHQMLQYTQPDTFILASGRAASVRDFVVMSFRAVGVHLSFTGQGLTEVGIDEATQATLVRVNPEFYRPLDTKSMIGDASKAASAFSWTAKTSLEELCRIMVQADLARTRLQSLN